MVNSLHSSTNKEKSPLISFVFVGRNDNYGGDFKQRLQTCVTTLYNQLVTYNTSAEIIFVNYNPLPTPIITDFIEWPKSTHLITVKIITVSPEEHQKFVDASNVDDVPVLEYPAKNAGIRRANGEYIVAMNPDIVIDDLFFETFPWFNKNHYYRVNRIDYQLHNDEEIHGDVLNFAKNNCTKVWVKAISKSVKRGPISTFKFRYIVLQSKIEIFRYQVLRSLNFLWSEKLHAKAENRYHCNVSGDFMLMHRLNWDVLLGYHEKAKLALHIDSLMVVQAASFGLKEVILPFPIYHQEHERRYDATTENLKYREAYMDFQNQAQEMLQKKQPKIYNSENWGFSSVSLEEITL
jgi:hypothetical protein